MSRLSVLALSLSVFIVLSTHAQDDAEAQKSLGYNVGVQVGRFLEPGSSAVDLDALIEGLRDVMTGADIAVDDDSIAADWGRFQQLAEAKLQEELAREGQEYLASKAEEEGVQKTASGLLYKVLRDGSGKRPTATDSVTVHYRGSFTDGSEFDSSYSRNEPTSFPLGGVIPGWTEGLQLMPIGSKYEFYIPYNLAYGPQGRPPRIPPFATLVFEVELISVDAP